MKKSALVKYILSLVILITWLSVFTTFWASILIQNTKLVYKLSNNIYLNSQTLNKTYLIYKSNNDLSWAYFQSSCNVWTKLIWSKSNLYLFELTVKNKDCSNNVFFLKSKDWILNETELNLVDDYKLYNILLDYSSKDLNALLKTVSKLSSSLKIFNDYKTSLLDDKYNFSKKKRNYEELVYKSEVIISILEKREQKYIIPVPWYDLPTSNASKIPNSWRPYRQNTTDWIHHSWDIDAPYWTKVVALDDWIVVRIVNWWEMSDLQNIREWKNLSDDDKARNLDLLRWNQIWIKTMKWEVVMYAHLSKIVDSLKEWVMIKKWDYIWNIWITWVPDAGYTDYHLDFSICENPYNLWKVWSYDIVDYMRWSWIFKWKSKDYIVEHQWSIFKK